QDVTFTYPNSHQPMLRGISFSAAPNETIAIIGATGAGKTTFFQLLPRLYEPDDGKILLDGQPLSSYSVEQLREQIGYVSQVPLLFSGTIKDNITFGHKHATEKAMIKLQKMHKFTIPLRRFQMGMIQSLVKKEYTYQVDKNSELPLLVHSFQIQTF